MNRDRNLLAAIAALSAHAGALIMRHYEARIPGRDKADKSPVTDADEEAETLILEGLARLMPGVPVVSEEAAAGGHIPAVDHAFLLVDPLDGTKEFLARNGEFTVNVALIEAGRPVLGVVYAPALANCTGPRPRTPARRSTSPPRRRSPPVRRAPTRSRCGAARTTPTGRPSIATSTTSTPSARWALR